MVRLDRVENNMETESCGCAEERAQSETRKRLGEEALRQTRKYLECHAGSFGGANVQTRSLNTFQLRRYERPLR
jgi:hypothetical protein